MSQPPAYSRAFSFTNFMAANPSLPVPGTQIDIELNNAKKTLDAVLANLALIQRGDGKIANASVGLDQLSAQVVVGFNAPSAWVTGTTYAANSSTVFNGSGFYSCLVAHTSGTFSTDLAAGNWKLIVNLASVPLVAASQIAVTPSGSLTTDVQGSLQALDTGKAPLSHTQLSSTISDSTTAGRALLTAANTTAQNALLGTSLLGFQSGDIKETACPVLQSGWYYCDGSTKNRVTDAALFNAITIQQTASFTVGSPVVTGLSDTSNLSPGMPLYCSPVQNLVTVVKSVDSGTQITMSSNAISSATTMAVFAPYGVGDGTSSFGLPNRAYIGVGRDNAGGSASNITQLSGTLNTTLSSAVAVVNSASGLVPGMYVTHGSFPNGTQISSISGTSLTLSNVATANGVLAARFSLLRDAQTLGTTGGSISQSTVLVTANLPPYTPSGSVTSTLVNGGSTLYGFSIGGSAVGYGGTATGAAAATISSLFTVTSAFSGAAQGGTSTPLTFATMQPTIVMNYIIKR